VAALGALALTASLMLIPGAPDAGAATQCAHARAEPDEATLRQLKRAVACLINERRRNGGKPRLDRNRKLNSAATGHTEKMLAQDCFAHKCSGEPNFERRIDASGYSDGVDRWRARENLGYAPTPRKMVRAFLDRDTAPAARKSLLNPNYRDIGIGAGRGVPVEGKPDDTKVTYTVILAWRRR
jgi:uncharacterized protein YkwD